MDSAEGGAAVFSGSCRKEDWIENPCDAVDLLDMIEARTAPAERNRRGREFMLGACERLARLPDESADWLRTARAYAAGKASEDALLAERLNAWQYLDARSCRFDDPEVSAVRAVLFVLYPPGGEEDWIETGIQFLRLCEGAGADPAELCRRLREAFADVLG